MFNLEDIFAGFIDQLSQRHLHGLQLLGLRSRRIQRSLRLIEAAQGGCWTAPCSPAGSVFGEITSTQPEALVMRDTCHARVQSWRNAPLVPIASGVLDFPEPQGNRLIDSLATPNYRR